VWFAVVADDETSRALCRSRQGLDSRFLVNRKRRVEQEMGEFASARVEKLIRNAGAQRVSAEAIDKMNDILTDYGVKVAKYAVELARHSGRKTIKENDVRLAAEK
jgi:histone H3/H4